MRDALSKLRMKDIRDYGQRFGWDIRQRYQPTYSADLNDLDLGLLNGIMSIQNHI